MRLFRWFIIQYDLCPYKERKLWNKHKQKKDNMKTQRENDQEENSQKKPAMPTP